MLLHYLSQVKAFPLVIAELDARAHTLVRQSLQTGARQPIGFSFYGGEGDGDSLSTISLPEECFTNVMHYLEGKEIVFASLVSKVWLSASRLPAVWEDGLDMSRLNYNKALNMTSLLKLLARPQFATLKGLALPRKVKLGKSSVRQLAKLLPHLETFDVGYYNQNAKATDTDLLAVATQFGNLTSLRTDMWNVTSSGIVAAARAMGGELVDLRITADTITKHYPSRATVDAILESCPNLRHFAYRTCSSSGGSSYYDASLDGMRGNDIIRLVQGCRCLETLELYRAMNVTQEHFVSIASMVASDLDAFSLRKLVAYGYDNNSHSIRRLLASYSFLQIEDKFVLPKLSRGIRFLGVGELRFMLTGS